MVLITAQLGVARPDWGQRKIRNITPGTHPHLGKLGWRHVLPMGIPMKMRPLAACGKRVLSTYGHRSVVAFHPAACVCTMATDKQLTRPVFTLVWRNQYVVDLIFQGKCTSCGGVGHCQNPGNSREYGRCGFCSGTGRSRYVITKQDIQRRPLFHDLALNNG